MAGVAKVTLNGTTLIDVTGKTVSAGTMVSGTTALDKKGDGITGTIANKSSSDLTASGSTVTVPAGYYSTQATKNVASTTHPNPTAAIASSTGVVTATHTQTAGYVAAGTTTGTLNLTTQAAQIINTSTADQTIASYRWLTGTQTIKSVTTANITAANIVSGVTVKVGDANNASRILQIIGTAPTGTARAAFAPAVTLASSTGVVTGTNTFTAGVYPAGTSTSTLNLTTKAAATINTSTADQTIASYRWLTGTQTIKSVTTSNLTAENIKSGVTVQVGDVNNASRITQVTGTCTGQTYTIKLRKNVLRSDGYVQYGNTKYTTAGDTFQVTPGSSITIYLGYGGYHNTVYIIEGTTVTANQTSLYTYTPTGNCEIDWELENIGGGDYDLYGYIYTNIYPLTYRGTYTWNPASYNTTISSGTLLTGDQTILSVTTTNLTAANIVSGVTIKVGDVNNASRITQVTGTYSAPTYDDANSRYY